ncbi:protein-disulfide reductase DsbD family protein [Persicitalea jodogahamensis]|uniref:Thiol:disulfide interchange protein n=1 Tax=Persicitalea jodogahamensis TaxID=402147 RepID=A0A8J3G9H4_9BACT|nr:thioredoxin family protein [Persicitalea jodogahamensis]GHB66932.1 thiol:disulfide interchange protein [Persicitalea jodogahamensis]
MTKITAALGAAFLLLSHLTSAQVQRHATWTHSFSKKEVKVGETVDLVFKATIDPGWYMYSNDFDADLGPMLTEIALTPNASFEKVGKLKPIKPKKKFEEVWQGDVTYFEAKAEFHQTVRILKENPTIKAAATYQTCSNVTGLCVLGNNDFTFTGLKVAPAAEKEQSKEQASTTTNPAETATSPATDETFTEAVQESLIDSTIHSDTSSGTGVAAAKPALYAGEEASSTGDGSPGDASPGDGSLWAFAVAAFLAGLVALLTPCVFPIIPMTVSFFTKQKNGKSKALIYGLSIILIYTLIGTIVSRLNGPAFANFVSTHWLPNLLFFAIFFLFGLSFLGLFEIVLPSSFVNKMDEKADQGGMLGVFFMAFTLVLVSFSCTGPIVGSLLVASAGGEVVKPIVGMVAFSSAFAIPFTLFALFPQWLKSLPKSGGWLNTVKVVLGFLELALALKFLSIADQVYHWRLLDREIYLAFWIVIFAMLGAYLLGKIRTPHDSPTEIVSVPRILLSIVTFAFVVYMIPGMWGAPLKALAGYLPPQSTHDFDLSRQQSAVGPASTLTEVPKYADLFDLPHDLEGFFDYEQALAYSKKVNKPVFIDFTGHGCVNCREMEARVWSDPAVLQRLREDYVIVALYVDDKTELPEDQWYTSPYDQRVKKTIGAQNADLQIRKYNNNAQPHYCLVDSEGNLLVAPINYDLNPEHFAAFLDSGKGKI